MQRPKLGSSSVERLRRIDAVLEQALDLEGGERAKLLERECAGDPGLLAEVEALLEASEAPTSPLDTSSVDGSMARALLDRLDGELPLPERIGPYRPLRVLGRGGMAVVYLAERADGQFEQEVAVKVIGGHRPSRDALRLFERERQILASLEHPNIARLLDGGVTDEGYPYLVMEHVQGRSIDRHCDESKLSIGARLRLFVDAVRAVQHAHGRLVLHRDLKPSNILVDQAGRVKLLDFGIARLISDDDLPAATLTAASLMTPAYASPEQVAGEPVSTASDVYQLGLLLYRLLVGCHAYEVDSSSPSRVERTIRERLPTAPSARLRGHDTPGDAPAQNWSPQTAAAARGESRAALMRRLQGELDTVVLKALHKESARRYPSAEAFAEDIERHLAGLPVSAHPDSAFYRLRKLVGRHRLATASIVGGVIFAGYHLAVVESQNRIVTAERDRARIEASRATEIRSFLVDLFEDASPERFVGHDLTVREVLDQGAIRIDNELEGQPEIRAELLATIGDIYRSLGLFEEAGDKILAADALDIGGRMEAEIRARLGRLYHDEGRLAEAAEVVQAALATARREAPDDELLHADLLVDLATILAETEHDTAREAAEESRAIRLRHYGPEHDEVAATLDARARIERSAGNVALAKELLSESLAIRESLHPTAHPRLARSLVDLGSLLGELGPRAEGIMLLERALAMRIEIYGPDHPAIGSARSMLAHGLRRAGRFDEAGDQLRQALAIFRAKLEPDSRSIAQTHNGLGMVLEGQQDWAGAEAEYTAALAIYGPEIPNRMATEYNLASVRRQGGKVEEAARSLERMLAESRESRGPDHWSVGHIAAELGLAYRQLGRRADAVALFEEARRVYGGVYGSDSERVAAADVLLAAVLVDLGRLDEAESKLDACLRHFEGSEVGTGLPLALTRLALGRIHLARDEGKLAEPLLRAAAEILGDRRDPHGQEFREVLATLG